MTLFLKLLVLCFFLYFVATLDVSVMIQEILSIGLINIVLVAILDFITLFVKTIRWKVLLDGCEDKFQTNLVCKLYRCNLIGSFFGVFTPGRLGEFGKIFYARDFYPIQYKLLLGSSIVDRVFDLLLICIVSIIYFSIKLNYALLGIGLLFIIIFTTYLYLKKILLFMNHYFYNNDAISSMSKYFLLIISDKKKMLVTLSLTFGAHSFYIIGTYIIAKALNINLSYIEIYAIISTMTIVTLLPISFSGIGVRDVSLIYLLNNYSVSYEQIVALSTLILVCSILSTPCVGFIFYTFSKYNGLKVSNNNKNTL